MKKIITAILVLIATALVVGLAFAVRVPEKADMVAVIRTKGMTCASCTGKITEALSGEKGVAQVEVDLQSGLVFVGYDSAKARPDAFAGRLTAIGYASTALEQVTSADFRAITGRDVGAQKNTGGCCGSGGCGAGGRQVQQKSTN